MLRIASVWLALVFLLAVPVASRAAGPDGNVEWNGVSHLGFQDRRPICPLGGESFDVLVRAYRNDLTAVRVLFDEGSGEIAIDAALHATVGPYSVWKATLPATTENRVGYVVELNDGADQDFLGASGVTDQRSQVGAVFELDFQTLEHAPVGATLHPTAGVVFKVWSPQTTTAHVRGQFNGWGLGDPMTRQGEYWVAVVAGAALDHGYKYFFDNAIWNTDPRGRSLDAGDNYNAIVQDPSVYTWTSDGYEPPALEEMVIYQLHVGTYAGLNDPNGATVFPSRYVDVADRAAHLAELGVNAVMLNPITEFPGDFSAGYNPVTNWAPERKYGAPDDLRRLVDALHAEGIAVLLDIVWNHVAISDNFLWNYDGTQIYFDTPVVDTPWGAQADLDAPEVRDMYVHSAHMWMEDFRIDGFRMDATDFMNIGAHATSGWTLMQRLNDEADNRWADRVIIAEQLPDDAAVTRATSAGGAGFDAQYFDAFTDRLREELQDAAFGDPEMWKLRDVINGFGVELSKNRVVNYVELHDEAWPSSGGQRLVRTIDPSAPHDDRWAKGRTKLAQGLVLTAPGVPAMLQGTEWLESNDFGTDAVNRLDWSKKATYAGIFDYYRDLIALRTSRDELRADAYHQVFHLNEGGNVIGMRRGLGDTSLLVLANFSNTDYTGYRVGVPFAADWEVLIDSQDATYLGDGSTHPASIGSEAIGYDGFGQSIALDLPAMGLLVLQKRNTAVAVGPDPRAGTRIALSAARPNPSHGASTFTYRLPERQPVRATLHDLRGRRVRVIFDGIAEAGEHRLEVPTAGLARGTYFLRLRSNSEDLTRKITVVR